MLSTHIKQSLPMVVFVFSFVFQDQNQNSLLTCLLAFFPALLLRTEHQRNDTHHLGPPSPPESRVAAVEVLLFPSHLFFRVGEEDVLGEKSRNSLPAAHPLLSIGTIEGSLVPWWRGHRLWSQICLVLPLLAMWSWASPFTSKAGTQMSTFQSYFENSIRSHI